MLPIHTILFPTDFSEQSVAAFPLACSLARDCGARVVALHVVPPPLGNDPLLNLRESHEYYHAPWRALRKLSAPEQNVRVEHLLEDGDAAKQILKVAEDTKAGLIVIGTHGRTGLGRLFMGSVAEQVMRGAKCPVLTVTKNAVRAPSPKILCKVQ